MTFYEELGIAPQASDAEIQQARRHLLKLLHPDHQADPALRQMAEIQARRVNQMVDTLLDPEGRRQYDQTLLSTALRPATEPSPLRRPTWRTAAGWALAAGLLAAVLWVPEPLRPTPTQPPAAAVTPAPRSDPKVAVVPGGLPSRRSGLAEPRRSSAEPVRAAPDVLEKPEEHPLPDTPADPGPAPAPASPPVTSVSLATSPAPAAPAALEGVWLYVPAASDRTDRLYPPEYIELRIQRASDGITGRYRARYTITNRPLSPAVQFQFSGPESKGTYPWLGPNDSTGSVDLRLEGRNTLRVEWKATRHPDDMLVSGVAVLTRRESR